MKQLRAILIEEPWQVELMRILFNDNLATLSKPLPSRTYEEQQQWWNENKSHLTAYLYEPVDRPGKFVAFLLMRDRGGFSTHTIIIQKEEQGKKYGHEIVFNHLEKANGPIAATQLQSNKAICHINEKAGYIVLGEKDHPDSGKTDIIYHPGYNPEAKPTREVFESMLKYWEFDGDMDFSEYII